MFVFLGRICLSTLFTVSAVYQLFDWYETEKKMIDVLCDWRSYLSHIDSAQTFFSLVLSWSTLFLLLFILLELAGGLLLLFGIKPRLASLLLILFTVPATILFHQFWFLEGEQQHIQRILFFKNLAILGGLFFSLAYVPNKQHRSIPLHEIDSTKAGP